MSKIATFFDVKNSKDKNGRATDLKIIA